MASGLSLRTIPISILSLPPQLRATAYRTARSFSASTPKKLSAVDVAVAGPSAILDGVHALGIPWHTAIPLTAVMVRTTLVYYLSTRWRRRDTEIKNRLVPLAFATSESEWNSAAERKKRRSMKWSTERAEMFSNNLGKWWIRRKALNKLSRDHGVGRFRWWESLNFGVLIAFTEAVRLKCGTREGLLPLLLSPFTWAWGRITQNPASTDLDQTVKDFSATLAERLETARNNQLAMAQARAQERISGESTASFPDGYLKTLDEAPQQAVALDVTPATTRINTPSPYFDPSMQTEGLSWATNLTLPDPMMLLPALVFNTLVLRTILRPVTAASPSAEYKGPLERLTNMQRLGIVFAALFGWVSMNLPAAVLLYFIPNILAGYVQLRYLDWKYPIQPPIYPCKRPIRLKMKKGW